VENSQNDELRPERRPVSNMIRKLSLMGVLLVGGLWLGPNIVAADEQPEQSKRGFALGFGGSHVKFDTNVKFTDKETGYSVFVDAEGTLGLPESDTVPSFYGVYRFSRKHAFGFSYFQVRRKTTFIGEDLQLGGGTFSGTATLQDRTRFYNLTYRYVFFEDDRSRVFGMFGLYGLDLNYTFEADGEYTIGGDTETGVYEAEAAVFAPLPLFGLNFWFAFTPKWSINTRISTVGGSYKDVSAGVFQTIINARYQFNKRVGMLLGVTYFDADVKIEDSIEKKDVSYGYDGAFVGLHLIF
jgi:hypothetical protein